MPKPTPLHRRPAATSRAHGQPLPFDLNAVALVNATVCASAGSMSVSWWWNAVAIGAAPPPAVQVHRCTRWRLADVRRFWQAYAETGGQPPPWASLPRAARPDALKPT